MSDKSSAEKDTIPVTPPAGNVKLIVLIVILIGSIAWKYVDAYVFPAKLKAAQDKIEAEIIKHTGNSAEDKSKSHFMSRKEVHELLGMQPTRTEIAKNQFLVEYYCMYGSLPLSRRYLTVIYHDKEGSRVEICGVEMPIESELPLTEEEAIALSEKAKKESPNGPDRQMAPLSPPSIEALEPMPPVETATEKATEKSEPTEKTAEEKLDSSNEKPSEKPVEKVTESEEPKDTPTTKTDKPLESESTSDK